MHIYATLAASLALSRSSSFSAMAMRCEFLSFSFAEKFFLPSPYAVKWPTIAVTTPATKRAAHALLIHKMYALPHLARK